MVFRWKESVKSLAKAGQNECKTPVITPFECNSLCSTERVKRIYKLFFVLCQNFDTLLTGTFQRGLFRKRIFGIETRYEHLRSDSC